MTVCFIIADVFLCSELSHVQSSLISRVLRESVSRVLSGGQDTGSSPCSVLSFIILTGTWQDRLSHSKIFVLCSCLSTSVAFDFQTSLIKSNQPGELLLFLLFLGAFSVVQI